jgi:hypothetical protein
MSARAAGGVGAAGTLPARLAAAYAAGWLAVAAAALLCALVPAARWLAHHAFGLQLHARLHRAPAPSVDGALALLANNVRATCWPLLPVALRAERYPGVRRLVDVAVALGLAVNLLPVGAALGAYGPRLVPFLPQLPLELYATTAGPACWWLCSRRALGNRALAAVAGSTLLTLLIAAGLETWGVPHR